MFDKCFRSKPRAGKVVQPTPIEVTDATGQTAVQFHASLFDLSSTVTDRYSPLD
jgi:hypothetical protein